MTAVEHGTRSAYNNTGCRCLACREANSAYHRRYRERLNERRRRHPRLVPHGTASAYFNHGCRCDRCVDAGRRSREASANR